MVHLRSVHPEDIDSLYAVSLATGHMGKDAAPLYRDGRMIGHIYSAPYAHLTPETVLVAEDDQGVCGYIAGAFDTVAYEERLEREWWPALRRLYADPAGAPSTWNADQKRSAFIHHPARTPSVLTDQFPAHIHMNLLPRTQGRGIGTRLLDAFLANARGHGVKGVHLGANVNNHGGIRFWSSRGFSRLDLPPQPAWLTTVWFGRSL